GGNDRGDGAWGLTLIPYYATLAKRVIPYYTRRAGHGNGDRSRAGHRARTPGAGRVREGGPRAPEGDVLAARRRHPRQPLGPARPWVGPGGRDPGAGRF